MTTFHRVNQALLLDSYRFLVMWLPGGKRRGNEYTALNPRRHDTRLGSFTINLQTGQWADFASGDKGFDLISLSAYLSGVSQGEAARRLAALLGMDDGRGGKPFPILPCYAAKAPNPPKVEQAAPNPFAMRLWKQSTPAPGTVTETYLRGRGITCTLPPAIRHLARAVHKESGTYWPVMLAGVMRWPDDAPVAVHRTYLARDGKGKAPVEPGKMMLGGTGGGAVRFGNALDTIIVTEGIETAASVFQATGTTTWAGLSTSGIRGVILPPPATTPHVILAVDNDPPGIAAAQDTAERLSRMGYHVRLAVPSVSGEDFNDLLQGEVA